jgi:endogenous inhibitor of DNA gyrase (YacG/DUF329 family)
MKKILVTCPHCKKKFNYYDSQFKSFCSERCKMIDLGQWLTESYSVPVEKLTIEQAQTLEQLLHEKNPIDQENNEDS